jgi:hypothetical protein
MDGDLNMDPSKGIGRALLAALGQFAKLSGHQELASAKLILLGFSGTGSLVGRFAAYAPDRVLAVVATHPGRNPLGLEILAIRGGSVGGGREVHRTTFRGGADPTFRDGNLGFSSGAVDLLTLMRAACSDEQAHTTRCGRLGR